MRLGNAMAILLDRPTRYCQKKIWIVLCLQYGSHASEREKHQVTLFLKRAKNDGLELTPSVTQLESNFF